MTITKELRCRALALGCAALIAVLSGCPQTSSAPTVSSTRPVDGATGVPLNTKLTAVFSTAMDPETITATTFALTQGTVPVFGTVTYTGLSAVFVPGEDLAPNTLYTATIGAGAADLSGNALAADYVWTFVTGTAEDTTLPAVDSVSPADAETGVAVDTNLAAIFSEAMDPSTITTSTFTLAEGTTLVSGSVIYSGVTAMFCPATDLAEDTEYTATITTGAADLSGNFLEADRVWTFSTGTSSDTTVPVVSSTNPESGAVGVSPVGKITATFSEVMAPSTITASTFTLSQGATLVSGSMICSGVTAVFCPSDELTPDTLYTAKIAAGAADLSGNTLAGSRTWTFTTGAVSDTVMPSVSYTVPEVGAVNAPVGGRLSVTFSEPMDPLTITAETFTLAVVTRASETRVAGTVAYAGTTAVFTPAEALTAGTTYTASVLVEAADLSGNTLANDHVWRFTTGTDDDTTAPMVSFTTPANGATGAGINKQPAITFTEPMDPLTINAATFTLTQGTTPVSGTVDYAGVTAKFNPRGNLTPSTLYTATIAISAADLSGNTLASSYSWTFTTATVRDTTAPTLSSTLPADQAEDVPVNQKIIATFSEAMNPLTITTETFSLMQGTTAVAGSVIGSGAAAIFTPADILSPNTTYTAVVLLEATDLVGNALASDRVWTFTTGASSDATAPTVTSTSPVAGATGVSSDKKITVTFSEAVDPLTITTETFTLYKGTTWVAGTVSCTGLTATFTPKAALTASTVHTASVLMATKDLAGNTLPRDRVWTFTTGTT